MERKRKLPPRAAARQDQAAKRNRRTPTPVEVEPPPREPSPSPPPPPPAPLPNSIEAGKPLPTVEQAQPTDLSSQEYQSLTESGVLSESLARSRNRWINEGLFEKFWSKPHKRKGVLQEDPNNPPKDSMMKVGAVKVIVEPHIIEATMFVVKTSKLSPAEQAKLSPHLKFEGQISSSLQDGSTMPKPPTPARPVLQYGPSNGSMPPPSGPLPAATKTAANPATISPTTPADNSPAAPAATTQKTPAATTVTTMTPPISPSVASEPTATSKPSAVLPSDRCTIVPPTSAPTSQPSSMANNPKVLSAPAHTATTPNSGRSGQAQTALNPSQPVRALPQSSLQHGRGVEVSGVGPHQASVNAAQGSLVVSGPGPLVSPQTRAKQPATQPTSMFQTVTRPKPEDSRRDGAVPGPPDSASRIAAPGPSTASNQSKDPAPAAAKPNPTITSPNKPSASDPVIALLAQKASKDPELRDLMKRVAVGESRPGEIATFQKIISQLTTEFKQNGGQLGPPADQLIVDKRTVKYFADEVRTILDIVLASNPTQTSSELRPPPRSDPLVVLLVKTALEDARTQDMIRRIAEGKPGHTDARDLKQILDRLHRDASTTPKATPAATSTSQQQPVVAASPVLHQTNSLPQQNTIKLSQPQISKPKGPPSTNRPDVSAVVFDFGSGDRYLFPRYSILEFQPSQSGQHVIASFLIVRKGSTSEYGGDPKLDYYQPVTIRLQTSSGRRYLENLTRVVAPPAEVRRYMDDVMDNMTRSEFVLLAMRLPRADFDPEEATVALEDGKASSSTPKSEPEAEQHSAPRADVMWATVGGSKTVPSGISVKLQDPEQEAQTKYERLIRSVAEKEVDIL